MDIINFYIRRKRYLKAKKLTDNKNCNINKIYTEATQYIL